jgi:hypothetical protein
MGQGGRPALHAETATRGSEPVASPTGSEKIGLESAKILQRIESVDAFEGRPHVEALTKNQSTNTDAGQSGRQGEGAG